MNGLHGLQKIIFIIAYGSRNYKKSNDSIHQNANALKVHLRDLRLKVDCLLFLVRNPFSGKNICSAKQIFGLLPARGYFCSDVAF